MFKTAKPTFRFSPPLPPLATVVGTSIGKGISVFKIVKRDGGLARLVLGRSSLRTSVSTPYIIFFATSLLHYVIPEIPLFANMNAIMVRARRGNLIEIS